MHKYKKKPEKQEKKRKKVSKSSIVTIFLAVILVASIIGFMWTGEGVTRRYKDYKLSYINNKWMVNVDDKSMGFDYFPGELEYINITGPVKQTVLNTKMIYITYDPDIEGKEAVATAQFDIKDKLNIKMVYAAAAFTRNNSFGLPIITCDDATAFIPVLYFKEGSPPEIMLEGNCVIIQGSSSDYLRLKDRLLYVVFGIMEE